METAEITREEIYNAFATIKKAAKDSNFIKHLYAEAEIAWPGYATHKDEFGGSMQKMMVDDIAVLLSVLSLQGDSGASYSYKMSLLKAVADFKVLSPLKLTADEFNEPYNSDKTRQNKRMPSVFKDADGTVYDIDAIVKKEVASYDIFTGKLFIKNGGCWCGGVYLYTADGWKYCRGRGEIINFCDFTGANQHNILPTMYIVDSSDTKNDYTCSVALESAIPSKFFKDYRLIFSDKGKEPDIVAFLNKNTDTILNMLDKIKDL